MRACRKIAPAAPSNVLVRNTIQSINQQRLSRFVAPKHKSCRSSEGILDLSLALIPPMSLTNDGSPLVNRAGIVPNVSGSNFNSFIDNVAPALR